MKKIAMILFIAVCISTLYGCAKSTDNRDGMSDYSGDISNAYARNTLDLSNKGLSEIPDICNLVTGDMKYNIRSIYLGNNKISEISQDLSCLANLKLVDLSYNNIKSINNLNEIKQMESLDLSHNQIEKIENIDNLSALKELNLSFNTIKKIKGLDNFESLITLSLSHNAITKVRGLESLSNLEKITLEYNQISNEEDARALYSIGKLKWISLGMNPLPQSVIDEFNQWTQNNVNH